MSESPQWSRPRHDAESAERVVLTHSHTSHLHGTYAHRALDVDAPPRTRASE